ncbi:hypothetical protein V8F33_002089 [Rhypophila sp. PSN 637]
MATAGAKKTYIVEHLDEELGPWSELEYLAIARESHDAGSTFCLSSLPAGFKVPEALNAVLSFKAESRGVEEIYASDKTRVCLLDPAAAKDLSPEDGDNFDVFLFGGILGDDPPRDRTSELRKKGFEGRRLGPKQMTTDTAVRVTRIVVEKKVPLAEIPYVDFPELKFNEHEATEMPFRYVTDETGKPIMPEVIPVLDIFPPLVNSSNPWASTLEDLRSLYACPYTGAVTTRTSLINGFEHDGLKHQYVFLDSASQYAVSRDPETVPSAPQNGSLNSLGNSPYPLKTYLDWIRTIVAEQSSPPPTGATTTRPKKAFIVSVTGTPEEVAICYKLISETQCDLYFSDWISLAMEINLSCPNIPNKPPPAYSKDALGEYLVALKEVLGETDHMPRIPIGLKTPPYTYQAQFVNLIDALVESCDADEQCLITFLTATNTLGSCFAFSSFLGFSALVGPTKGIGGLAGAPLHPLALGNVLTLSRLLRGVGEADEGRKVKEKLGHIRIIGIGGVLDGDGWSRMRKAGASVVGIGTGLGLKGVGIFEEVAKDIGEKWTGYFNWTDWN